MTGWIRRLFEYKGPLPRGLVSMDVPPPQPTTAPPEIIVQVHGTITEDLAREIREAIRRSQRRSGVPSSEQIK